MHGKHACGQHSIKEDKLKTYILDDVRQLAKQVNEADVIGRLETKAAKAHKQMEKQLADLDKRIDRLKEEKNGLIKLLAVGKITDEEYQSIANSNNEEIHRLQAQKSGLETASGSNVVKDIGRLKS
jgi:site-specific DNA recombinase